MKAFFAGLIATLLGGSQVLAQIQTEATCAASFSWQENSLNQSPCLIAAYLQGACSAGVWDLPALPRAADGSRQAYNPPDATARNPCTCSWAVYNLISACAACQDGAWASWSLWSTNCTIANLIASQPFPPNVQVPSGTVIPEYAGKDPSTWTGSRFNVTEARVIGSHNIEISTTSSPSSTGSAPSSSNTSSSSNDASSGPAVGPIVGGVVGGILGLLLIAVLAAFLLCPARFRRGQKAGASESQEKQPDGTISQPPAGGSVLTYILQITRLIRLWCHNSILSSRS
ncbi:hypothetical protein M408DRAFT_98001 [Serendipita vermifera MAFF 305830]|uniref:Mid2 domain-containing protein n=1 Tax=Serendipita vermifera MAFF 305830 TaxID=933852 RepID=A0A0C2X952_SERVB|nr:hypothetical protein M408DRAFT_98001 [Serendipita vermifera MAFF 305830]